MTLVGFVLFYIGLILRFTYASTDDEFVAARYNDLIFIMNRFIQSTDEYISFI
jgi:hypothetical protein